MRTDKATIERLRRDLPTIRAIAGWSAERLAELLDVSRVTVVKLENTEGKMTVIQYLAIRRLLDEEIASSGNQQLAWAVEVLVDRDDVPESVRVALRESTARVARRVGRKAGSAALGRALGEMRLSELRQETVDLGMAIAESLLKGNDR